MDDCARTTGLPAGATAYGNCMSDATSGTETDGADLVDWGLAVTTARRLQRPGPAVSRDQARRTVSDLHEFAALAEGHVRDYTGLHAEGAHAPVLVVDRERWVEANTEAFRAVLAPLAEKVRDRRGDGAGKPVLGGVGSRLTGIEVGGLLAFLSGKVLGQFDPFSPRGRLLLVAPNVVAVERELGVEPRDFRLWVCLHEETHRVQFTAVPWLRTHLREEIDRLLQQTDIDPGALLGQLRQSLDQVGQVVRGDGDISLMELLQTPQQKEILDRVTAIMALLEGHADVVMDGVGPEVIPTVETIRQRFGKRREGGSVVDQLLKRLLGLDAKLKQYRDGARFVRHVVDRVGQDGFNRVWTEPGTLPSRAEVSDPDAWITRVHGAPRA